MKTIKEIYADVMQKDMVKTVIAKQYDCNSRFLCVRFASYGVIMQAAQDDVAVVNVQRSDGEVKAFRGTVNEDGSVTVPLTSWMSELSGTLKCDISIVSPDGSKLTSMVFPISVEPAVYSGEEISEDEHYDILVSLITDVQNTEAAITTAEASRVQAEEKRAAAETARDNSEKDRNTAEAKRVTSENNRINAETSRDNAEKDRQANENKRVSAEAERDTAEGKRASAEADRAAAESRRQTAENNRLSAETDRNTAESNRKLAEDNRAKAEALRAAAETQRANSEADRNSNEGNRISAESARVEAENARAQAETARNTAEAARAEAEENRNAELEKKADADTVYTKAAVLEKLCPHTTASTQGATLTITDGCGDTKLRRWVITSGVNGLGDLNEATGKYDIPVTVSGKNMLPDISNPDVWSGSSNILTYSLNDIGLITGQSYTISVPDLPIDVGVRGYFYLQKKDSEGAVTSVANLQKPGSNSGTTPTYTFTIEDGYEYFLWWNGTRSKLYNYKEVQIELGSTKTEYAPYVAPQTVTISLDSKWIPNNGIYSETTAIDIPLVTTGTNYITVGTTVAPRTIYVEYYQDINKVISNLTNAILSQGGNV